VLNAHEAAEDLHVSADYTLRMGSEIPRIVLNDPEILTLDAVGVSVPARSERMWTPSLDGRIASMLVLTPTKEPFGAAEQLTVQARWSSASRQRLNGSSVLAIPSALPMVMSSYNDIDASIYPDGAPIQPRSVIHATWPPQCQAGTVAGSNGGYLAAAIHMARAGERKDHAESNAFSLAGNLLPQGSTKRRLIARLVTDIHRFYDVSYGNGAMVRPLLVAEKNAYDYRRAPGEYCALDERLLQQLPSGRFPADRMIARDVASLWWFQGVRIIGVEATSLAAGLAMAMVLHGGQTTGRRETLRSELEVGNRLIEDERQRMRKPGAHTVGGLGARLALGIHRAAIAGIAVHREVQLWSRELWGQVVPDSVILKRLREIGVVIPKPGLLDDTR
jgi:hypothetical protein